MAGVGIAGFFDTVNQEKLIDLAAEEIAQSIKAYQGISQEWSNAGNGNKIPC